MKLIFGASVVDPKRGTVDRKDILIKDGKIQQVAEKINPQDYADAEIICADGKKV